MFYHYFLINQLPVVNDITKYINLLVVENTEYPLVIDKDFFNHRHPIIQYEHINTISNYDLHTNIYIKDNKVDTIRIYFKRYRREINLKVFKKVLIKEPISVRTVNHQFILENFNMPNGWYLSEEPMTLYYTLL